jgi:hypothetical protein
LYRSYHIGISWRSRLRRFPSRARKVTYFIYLYSILMYIYGTSPLLSCQVFLSIYFHFFIGKKQVTILRDWKYIVISHFDWFSFTVRSVLHGYQFWGFRQIFLY